MFRSTFQSNYSHLEASAEHAELQSPIFTGARGNKSGEEGEGKKKYARV